MRLGCRSRPLVVSHPTDEEWLTAAASRFEDDAVPDSTLKAIGRRALAN